MSGIGTNILTATTTELFEREGELVRVTINKAVASAVVTLYDNITEGTIAADPNGVALSQTPIAGGVQQLTIIGGAVTLGYGMKATVTSAADDTGRTFTVTGTNAVGTVVTDAITGVSGSIATGVVNFKTITGITTDDDTAGAIEAGFTVQSGTKIATITMPATLLLNQDVLEYEVALNHGLTIVTSSTADITVVSIPS